MNRKSKIFLLIIFIVFIGLNIFSFINQRNIEKKIYSKMPDKVSIISQSCLEYLLHNEAELLHDLFVDEYKNQPNSKNEINRIIKQLEDVDKPIAMDLIGYHFNKNKNNESHQVSYQLEFENYWSVYTTLIVKTSDEYKLYRFNFNRTEESLLETNRFNLNKGVISNIVLFLVIIVMLFTFITSAICFGSKDKKRILWTFLILCGIGSFKLNWTTGDFGISFINIGIPSFNFGRVGSYAPIVLSLRFPLFAILYWVKRHKQTIEEVVIESEIEDREMVNEILHGDIAKEK